MAQYTRELFQPSNFNLAFEQMCNFAAIAKTRNADRYYSTVGLTDDELLSCSS